MHRGQLVKTSIGPYKGVDMRFEERDYQLKCKDAWVGALSKGLKSIIAVPTGAGKSIIMCESVLKWIELYPDANVLILSHTKEIVEQDYNALLEYFPSFGVGIYQAGLGKRQVRKVTVGGIHSVYKHYSKFKGFDLVIIDEVHAVNHKNRGMYRTFLRESGIPNLGGMSATIFRSGYGYIHKGDESLFNHLAYDLTSLDNFNKLVSDGYLTTLISKATELTLDSSKVKKSAGDYNIKDLAKTHDKLVITKKAVKEVVKFGKNYKKWLVFAIDTDHASSICRQLRFSGIAADELHTNMKGDRETVINDFKYGSTRALVSVGMVTTGFDAPNIDLIVLLRPTMSAVLHVQMVGRGLRVFPGKTHCLVLDFAGNTARLGPINNVIIPSKKKKTKGAGDAPTKTCPKCKVITYASAKSCTICGHEFEFKTKLQVTPDSTDIVQKGTKDTSTWHKVASIHYSIHTKLGAPNSLMVTYLCGTHLIKEWVCLDHKGFAKTKADAWVRYRWKGGLLALTVEDVYRHRRNLKVPSHILVQKNGKYLNIINSRFDNVRTDKR